MVLVSPSLNGFVPQKSPAYLDALILASRQQNYSQANQGLLSSEIMAVPAGYENLPREMVSSSRQWMLPYELMQQNPEPVLANLPGFDIPSLIMLGEEDIQAITELGNLLAQALQQAQLLVIPGGRHLLNLSQTEAFNAALARFVMPGQ